MHVLGLLLLKCIESQILESQRGPKNSNSFALAKLASSHSQEALLRRCADRPHMTLSARPLRIINVIGLQLGPQSSGLGHHWDHRASRW